MSTYLHFVRPSFNLRLVREFAPNGKERIRVVEEMDDGTVMAAT